MRFYSFERWLASWSWRHWLLLVVALLALGAGLDAAERRGWLPARGPVKRVERRVGY